MAGSIGRLSGSSAFTGSDNLLETGAALFVDNQLQCLVILREAQGECAVADECESCRTEVNGVIRFHTFPADNNVWVDIDS